MEAKEKSFSFMRTSCYYDIPFFQRAYVWSEDNWQELLDNFFDQTESHFLGSIILKQEHTLSGEQPRYMIIDGQQRLTTLSILVRACFDRLNEEKDHYSEKVTEKFRTDTEQLLFILPDMFADQEDVKIQHSKLDAPAFQNVIKGKYVDCYSDEGEYNKKYDKEESKIIRCYLFFRRDLHQRNIKEIEKLWMLLTTNNSSYLVNIDLGMDENEQKIFDTVNSFGVRLSSADTIKNAVFQEYIESLRREQIKDVNNRASQLHDKTWERAFDSDDEVRKYWDTTRRYGRMTRDNLEVFLYSFAVINGFFDPATDNMVSLASKYKKKIHGMSKLEIEEFLESLKNYADVFRRCFSNFDADCLFNFNDYKLRLLHICHVFDVATFYPYILKLIYAAEYEKSLPEEKLKDLLLQLERYIVLNTICNGSTKNYNNECVQLIRGRKTPDELKDASNYINRSTFTDGIRYMRQNKIPTLLLFWVELYDRMYQYSDIKDLKYDYTLEHIMPQKWQTNWAISVVPVVDENGKVVTDEKEATEIRTDAVYEIGNMTLLNSKLNTSVSNSTFEKKINGDGKNPKNCVKAMADLYLTREIIHETEWNEGKIYARTDKIQKKIEKIWNISFEEDKPVHIEVDPENMQQSYYEVFRGKDFLHVAEMIDRSDLTESQKMEMMGFLYNDIEDFRIFPINKYSNSKSIMRKEDIDALYIIGKYTCGPVIDVLTCVENQNEDGALKYTVQLFNNVNHIDNRIINESDLYLDAILLVKNRFTDFYDHLVEELKKCSIEPSVLNICSVLDEYYQSSSPEEIIELLEPVYKENKNSAVIASFLGSAYYDNKQWYEAASCFESLLQINTITVYGMDWIHFALGYAHSQLKNHDKSINHYLEAVHINSGYAMAYNNLGYEYYLIKQYDKAIDCYKESMKLNPNDTYSPNNIAIAYIHANRLEELKEYMAHPPIKLRKATIEAAEKALNSSK